METPFFCRQCKSEHAEPALSDLGHHAVCLECAMQLEFESTQRVLIILDADVAGPALAA